MPTRVSATAEPKRNRRGCRCCCLGCLLVFVVLIGTVTATWFMWGREWLERQYALVDRAVPGLGVVLDLARGHAPFAAGGLPSRNAHRESTGDFPADVWSPQPRRHTTIFAGDGISVAVFDVPGGAKGGSPIAWRREMSNRGWQRIQVSDPSDGSALLFHKESATCAVQLIPRDDGSVRIWLRVDRHTGSGGPE